MGDGESTPLGVASPSVEDDFEQERGDLGSGRFAAETVICSGREGFQEYAYGCDRS